MGKVLAVAGVGVAALALLKSDSSDVAKSLPRGIRNNNPLNIEKGESWQGLSIDQPDSRFAVFRDARYGFRAAARVLKSYKRRGVVTLGEIINTWAPSFENDTASYVNHVSGLTGIGVGDVVSEDDYAVLLAAMTEHENGVNPYQVAFIEEGVSWA